MSELQMINTVGAAMASSASRGAISVIDRFQFGIRGKRISLTNVHGSLAAFCIFLLAILLLDRTAGFTAQFLNIRVVVFAFLLQIAAQAFSYAFSHMKVPSVIVVSKFSDVLVGPFIFLLFGKWSTPDFTFAIATSLGCLLILSGDRRDRVHWKAAVCVCGLLSVQAALSPWYMVEVIRERTLWISFTGALLMWRLVFSVFLSTPSLRSFHASFLGHGVEYWALHGLRAVLTLSAQIFQVLALSWDRPVLAWPILNATGLFAMAISFVILKERATSREMISILFLLIAGAVRVAW